MVRALILDHVEAFNTHDRARLLGGLAEDVVWSTGRDTIRGVEALAEIFDDGLWAMQPLLTVEHLLVQGNRGGAQMTEALTVAGERCRFAIAVFFHVQRGRIQQAKVYREGTADID
jgi:ketosteroid isomerase-like protein